MNKKELESLEDDDDTVIIHDGIKVAFSSSSGSVTVYTNGEVKVRPAANDDAGPKPGTPRRPGDKMPDGTIFAGISPDTGKPMYTTPADAPLKMKWREAMDYAAGLEAHGHKDWHLPNETELNVLFNNRASIGRFDDGWYWSSSEHYNGYARIKRFSDGYHGGGNKGYDFLVRCVRC